MPGCFVVDFLVMVMSLGLTHGGLNFVSASFLRVRMLKGRCNEIAPPCEARLRQSRHVSTNPIF